MVEEATTEETRSNTTLTIPQPQGGILQCAANRFGSDRDRTKARLDDDVAENAARRLGTLAILTALTVVGSTILLCALQPELAAAHETPVFRLSALFLLLASVGLAALERSKLVRPQVLLDAGLAFEVAGAFAIGMMENSAAWPDSPVRGSTAVAAWIAICVLVISNRPWKSFIAAGVSAGMVPAAHLLSAQILGYPAMPWNRLASYTIGPLFVAGWTPFLSTRIYRMQKDLSRTTDLGSYRLESLLGKGGMGEVWRARHRLLRREAAVKLVRPDIVSRAGDRELQHIRRRFELEAQAIASLRSPHTVALYDFGTSDDGSLYYAMELLEGLDAQTLVKQYGPQPAGRVISFIRQVCDSLDEAHDLRMVHRDLKPTNLYVCRLGKQVDFVKVLDFGLVKAILDPGQAQLTMQGETSGTPAFMAPEQVRGEPDIDDRADIYSLGCVAYFLLTGALVFDEPSALSMALAHVERTPTPPSQRSELSIPGSLERVIMACLEKKRERRPQSVAELASLLERCTEVPEWTPAHAKQWWALHYPAQAKGASA
jgi:eukaryotic-like serine/threonine-protein kinase